MEGELTLELTVSTQHRDEKAPTHVHKMPCKINHNDTANVETYWYDAIQTNENETLKASFRGRPVQGEIIKFEPHTMGFVFDTSDEHQWSTSHSFNEFTNWSLDRDPALDKQVHGTLTEWIPIAEAIHKPI
jgi:hypothetical protein